MDDIYAWIDAHRDELVAELQTLLRQPSISAQKIGLDECAALLRGQMASPTAWPTRASCPCRGRRRWSMPPSRQRPPAPRRCSATATTTCSRPSRWSCGSTRPLAQRSAMA